MVRSRSRDCAGEGLENEASWMRRVGGMAAIVAAGVMALAGCSGGDSDGSSTTTVTETVTESPGSSSAAEAAESGPPEVKYGKPIEGETVKLTVSDVRDVTDQQDEYDDGTWAAMIEICATGDTGGPVAPMDHFVLLGKDGSTFQPSGVTGGNLPAPQLDPGSVSVPTGKCRKGNLFFDAPADANITGAEAVDSSGELMGTWGS